MIVYKCSLLPAHLAIMLINHSMVLMSSSSLRRLYTLAFTTSGHPSCDYSCNIPADILCIFFFLESFHRRTNVGLPLLKSPLLLYMHVLTLVIPIDLDSKKL